MNKVIRYIPLFLVVISMAGCSLWGKEEDETRDWSAQRLYSSAKERLNSGDYEKAVDYYEKLETRYPFGPLAQQAQLDVIYAYYRFDEPASAIAAADRFIKLHPRHPNVDYAYYLKGLVHFIEGKTLIDILLPVDMSERDPSAALQSFRAFEDLLKRYPESRYAEDSRQRMLYLRNILAGHEIHVARYYMKREAFLAAANRARFVVENYQRTPSVPDALVVMAKAYNRLDMNDLSADAVRVLKLNYPDHPDIAEVEQLVSN